MVATTSAYLLVALILTVATLYLSYALLERAAVMMAAAG